MCVFHGEGENCDFCEAPLRLEAVYEAGAEDPELPTTPLRARRP